MEGEGLGGGMGGGRGGEGAEHGGNALKSFPGK